MIKANELRIGNLVFAQELYTGRKEIIEISTIWGESDRIILNPSILDGGLDLYYTSPEPIPLTPEILERCGFKKDKRYSGNQSYSNEDIIIEETNGGYELYASEWTIGETFFYLHQLQNICLDLFKFKLEIKELQHA